ncbi:hypothetical protein D1007_16515 [Hordeum vulgare]|nr:hypothetical protein D1007_16515 [Hordeum vulgare]
MENREGKNDATIDLDEHDHEASGDGSKRIPTPNSVSYSKPKRPLGEKLPKDKNKKNKKKKNKKKRKKGGDEEIKSAMKAFVKARKEANEERRVARRHKSMTEERRVAADERKVALEEKKLFMEKQPRLLEWEKYLFFMDTSNFDERQKEYIIL